MGRRTRGKKQTAALRSRLGGRATVVALGGWSREGPYSGCEGVGMVERRVPELQRGTQRRCRWALQVGRVGCRETEMVRVVPPQQATATAGVQEQERRVPLQFKTDMVWVAGTQRTALWQRAGSGAVQCSAVRVRERDAKSVEMTAAWMGVCFAVQWGQAVSFWRGGGPADQWQAGDKLR